MELICKHSQGRHPSALVGAAHRWPLSRAQPHPPPQSARTEVTLLRDIDRFTPSGCVTRHRTGAREVLYANCGTPRPSPPLPSRLGAREDTPSSDTLVPAPPSTTESR